MRDNTVWFSIIGIGSQGPEMLFSSQDKEAAEVRYPMLELRARFNSPRRIKLFCFVSRAEITWEDLENKKFCKQIIGNENGVDVWTAKRSRKS